ncbi:hypothetical protein [Mycolicibacterium fallax]|nr:hypothetical protein [Mycolicibacterium fallax]BBY99533.1 hypothetical protein MFAL_30000 [Mycolicibacterium fallax]
MTDTPDTPTEPTTAATESNPAAAPKPNRLYQAAAWVAIVAGTLFIVGTVFFAGMIVGHRADGHGGQQRGHDSGMMQSPHHRMGPGGMGGMGAGCPMMRGGMQSGMKSDEDDSDDARTPRGPGSQAPAPAAPGQPPR